MLHLSVFLTAFIVYTSVSVSRKLVFVREEGGGGGYISESVSYCRAKRGNCELNCT